jgi:hypothetical protein
MAFQTGTQVRPELGRADVSGFARAGMITGQALANLGRNKQITATSLAQLEAIGSARPDAYAALKTAGGDVSQSISNIEKGDYKQKDVLAALGAINTYLGTQEAAQQSRNTYLGTQEAAQQSRLREAQIAEMERKPGKIIVRPDGIIEQDGKFMGQMSKQAAERIPTKVLEQRNFQDNYKKARELLSQGKVAEAQDITTSLGIIDKITGYPIPVSELFKDIEPEPTPKPEPTPTPAPGSPLNEEELERLNQLRSKRAGL